MESRRDCSSPGFFLCLLALALFIKPLANIVASYTCSDGQKKIVEDFQDIHLLSVSRMEKGYKFIITRYFRFYNAISCFFRFLFLLFLWLILFVYVFCRFFAFGCVLIPLWLLLCVVRFTLEKCSFFTIS